MKPGVAGETVCPLPDCQSTFYGIARHCIESILEKASQAASGDPDAIHEMRIELTRLRAARFFFSSAVKGEGWLRLDNELGWLNGILGRARNRDVAVEYTSRKRYREWARNSRHMLMRRQDTAHRQLAKQLASVRYKELESKLGQWISGGPAPRTVLSNQNGPADVYCDEHLRQWRNRITRQGRHISRLGRKQLHQLRIQSKHFRYMVDALLAHGIPISPEDFSLSEVLKRVHQTLGDLRDIRRLRQAVGRRPPRYRKRKRKLIQRLERSFRGLALSPAARS